MFWSIVSFVLALIGYNKTLTSSIPVVLSHKPHMSHYIVGIYSICIKTNNINSKGLFHHLAIKRSYSDQNAVGYISFDVCNDTVALRKVAISLLLDRSFQHDMFTDHKFHNFSYSDTYHGFYSNYRICNDTGLFCSKGNYLSQIIGIDTYLPEDMLKMLSDIILFSDIPVIYETDNRFYTLDYTWFRSIADVLTVNDIVLHTLNIFKWQSITLICFTDKQNGECKDLTVMTNRLTELKICFAVQTIVQNCKDCMEITLYQLKLDKSKEVVVLFGNDKMISQFLILVQKVKILDKTWILAEYFDPHVSASDIWINMNPSRLNKHNPIGVFWLTSSVSLHDYQRTSKSNFYDIWIEKYLNQTYSPYYNDSIPITTYISGEEDDYLHKLESGHYEYATGWSNSKTWLYQQRKLFVESFRDYLAIRYSDPVSNRFFHYNLQKINELQMKYGGGLKLLPCQPTRPCKSGYFVKLKSQGNKKNNMIKGLHKICSQCLNNSISPWEDHTMGYCIPCNNRTIANLYRTKCVDIYTNVTLTKTSIFGVVVLSSTGGLFSTFALLYFYLKRKTPMVRSSNYLGSVIQLVDMILFNVFTPLCYIGPTEMKCAIKALLVGCSFALFVSISLMHMRNLRNVFRAKRKFTRKKVRTEKAIQVFVCFLFVLISIALAFILIIRFPKQLTMTENFAKKQREHYCITDTPIYVQIVYIFLLLVAGNLESFRSRNLPTLFNNSKNVLYGTLMTMLCFLLLIPFSYSTRTHNEKIIAELLLILLAALLFNVCLFGGKLHIIVCCPYKNTKEAFHNSTLMEMKRHASKSIPRSIAFVKQ